MTWDVAVVGAGAMGSAAAWRLARRGARVLLLERQARIPHDRGSSHGETRVIRRAYFEHPAYVPLLGRAYRLWRELEAGSGLELLGMHGVLVVGPPEGEVVRGIERASAEHGVPVERIDGDDIPRRFPGFAGTEGRVGLLEPQAGLLHVERSVQALVDAARASGAAVRVGREVESLRLDGDGVELAVDGEPIRAGAVVVAGGAWASRLLGDAIPPLRVTRKVQLWLAADRDAYPPATSPVFAFDSGERFFYGFPALEPGAVKLAEHTGGERVPDPDRLDRALRDDDLAGVTPFVRAHLPRVRAEVLRHAACMYTSTSDGHFVIDRLPEDPRVIVAAGFSGHGFKLAPTVGEMVADLVLDPSTPALPLFSASRFGDRA